jgi:hypothetical protein
MDEGLTQPPAPPEPDPLVEETRAFWHETGKTFIRESIGSILLSGRSAISGEIPRVLHIPNAGTPYPAWVAAERVLTPSGEIDPSLFSLSDRLIIGQYLRMPAREGCIRLRHELQIEEPTAAGPKAARQNLASTAKSAGWVLNATVTARAAGFSASLPGTLLEIVPEEILKGPRDRGGVHYIFFPVGTFSVGGIKICKTDDDYADLPEVGEHVLLFIDLFWRNEDRFLWAGGDSGIISINKEGLVSLPKRYLATDPSLEGGAQDDLIRFVRKSIGRENARQRTS